MEEGDPAALQACQGSTAGGLAQVQGPGGKFQEGFHLSGGGGKELAFMKFLLRITGGLPGVAWVPGDRQK